MDNTILITGGGGFIGRHLVDHLLANGRSVRVLERPGVNVAHLPADKIDLVFADIRDRQAVAHAVRGCREVYHLAANPQLWTHRKGLFHQVNYLGAVNVIEQALDANVRRIVHTSSAAILTSPHHARIDVDAELPRLSEMPGPYCRAKLRAEQFALSLAKRGAPIVVVSPTLPIGPGDTMRSPPTQMMLDFCQGGRREYVEAYINLVDVRDVALGMVQAMRYGRPGTRYVLGSENWVIRDVFAALAELVDLPKPDRRVPYWVALTAAYISEWWADVVSHKIPAATVTGVKLSQRSFQLDAQPVWRELRVEPRRIRASLCDVIAWFRAAGWLPSQSGIAA